jgi:hypothetical protein
MKPSQSNSGADRSVRTQPAYLFTAKAVDSFVRPLYGRIRRLERELARARHKPIWHKPAAA